MLDWLCSVCLFWFDVWHIWVCRVYVVLIGFVVAVFDCFDLCWGFALILVVFVRLVVVCSLIVWYCVLYCDLQGCYLLSFLWFIVITSFCWFSWMWTLGLCCDCVFINVIINKFSFRVVCWNLIVMFDLKMLFCRLFTLLFLISGFGLVIFRLCFLYWCVYCCDCGCVLSMCLVAFHDMDSLPPLLLLGVVVRWLIRGVALLADWWLIVFYSVAACGFVWIWIVLI